MTTQLNRRMILAAGAAAFALPACQTAETKMDADIIVMGAGLSGLHTARLLTESGFDVLVVEANDRAGGRLYTFDHKNGYTEGGGEQIGASYARILDTANSLGVPLNRDAPSGRTTGYYYQNEFLDDANFKKLPIFPDSFAGSTPGAPLFRMAGKAKLFGAADEWRSVPPLSDISALEALKENGFSEAALKVVERALNANELSTYSMINVHRSMQLFSQASSMGRSFGIEGGAQRLPEAMAASLSRPVKYNAKIKAIHATETKVEVTLENGEVLRAAQAVCSLPFGALRHIDVKAPLLAAQKTAIAKLPYTQIFQFHFRATAPFWEQDDYPTDMWTDTPIERIFASLDDNGTPTGLYRSWINGLPAKNFGQMSEIERNQLFLDTLAQIRPSTKGNIEILNTVNWTQNNPLAEGAYMHWAPGQVTKWAEVMGKQAGALHFAGEHLGFLHTGMEAAMESAENTAYAIVDRS